MSVALRFEIDVPEFEVSEELYVDLQKTLRAELALQLFAKGEVSSGYAARMTGMERMEFLDWAASRQVSQYNLTEEEWRRELADAAEIERLIQARQGAA